MLRVFACLLTGAACLFGSVISTRRAAGDESGMVEQPEISAAHGPAESFRETRRSAALPPPQLPAKARGLVKDESLASRIRGESVLPVQMAGQITRPGPLAYTPGMTLKTAIDRAGGPTEFGSMFRVALVRDGKIVVHNMTKPTEQETPLQPGDRIAIDQKQIIGR